MSAPLSRRMRAWVATGVMAVADAGRLAGRGGGRVGALRYALRRRIRPTAAAPLVELDFDGVALAARPCDWCAVEEVLLEGEYDFVRALFDGAAPAVVLDLGANIGAFSARCLSLWPTARVVAVEAAADTYEVLAGNRRRNGARAWETVRGAVWSDDGVVSFEPAAQSTGSKVSLDGAGAASVPAIRLRTIVDRHGLTRVDVLKMDIEGAEEAVLATDGDVLALVDALIIEVHPDRCDHDAVLAIVRRHFAHVAVVPGRKSSKPLLVATRRPTGLPAYPPVGATPARGSR